MPKIPRPPKGTRHDARGTKRSGESFPEQDAKAEKSVSPEAALWTPILTPTKDPFEDVPMKWFNALLRMMQFPFDCTFGYLIVFLLQFGFAYAYLFQDCPPLFPLIGRINIQVIVAVINLPFFLFSEKAGNMLKARKWNGVIASHIYLLLGPPVYTVNLLALTLLGVIRRLAYPIFIASVIGGVIAVCLNIQYFSKRRRLFSRSKKQKKKED